MNPLSLTLSAGSTEPPELLDRARRGDPGAFCELCVALEGPLLRQALVLGCDAGQAEDLAQESLVIAWRTIDRFHGRCRLFTWVCGILLNLHRNAVRKHRPRPLSDLSTGARAAADWLLDNAVAPGLAPDEALDIAERAALLRRCLDRLPEKQRHVVHLRFFVDDSLEGIAEALECPVGTVKSRLFSALEQLTEMPELRPFAPNPSSRPPL